MDNWDEIRTAAAVVKAGTISEAAVSLGVHRATVNRHVELLESRLGAKLFLRHPRGVTPTELGNELLRVANATNDQFNQLKRLAKEQSHDLSGELVITSIDVLVPYLMPAVKSFRHKHPKVIIRIVSSDNILKLEYGEAHIALRAGKKPDDLDNVVLPFVTMRLGLYASQDYVDQFGIPNASEDYSQHYFIGSNSDRPRASFLAWMKRNVPDASIVLKSDQVPALNEAIMAGLGIGFLPQSIARKNNALVEVAGPRSEWEVNTWIVTHVDLHRSAKVQAFLRCLRSEPKNIS